MNCSETQTGNCKNSAPVRALELFSGIGGFAAAVRGSAVRVVAAYDRDAAARETYRSNFPEHPLHTTDLEKVTAEELAAHDAAFWWLSPPLSALLRAGEAKGYRR